jgi:hypothetical protein
MRERVVGGTAVARWNCQRWIQSWISGAVLRRDRGEAVVGGGGRRGGMRLKGSAMLMLCLWGYADEESFVLLCDVGCWSLVMGSKWMDRFEEVEGTDLILNLHFAIVQVFRVFNLLFTVFSCSCYLVLFGSQLIQSIVLFAVYSSAPTPYLADR